MVEARDDRRQWIWREDLERAAVLGRNVRWRMPVLIGKERIIKAHLNGTYSGKYQGSRPPPLVSLLLSVHQAACLNNHAQMCGCILKPSRPDKRLKTLPDQAEWGESQPALSANGLRKGFFQQQTQSFESSG